MIKNLLCLLALWGYVGNASLAAQITINETAITDDFGKVIKEVLYETNLDISSQLIDIINATGADQTWDFSNLNYVDSTVIIEEYMPVAADDPYIDDPNLAGSTFIVKNTLPPVAGGLPDTTFQYRYGQLDNGSWIVNGAITIFDLEGDGMVDTFFQWFSPPKLVLQFPVTSTSEWHDSTTLNQVFMGMVFTSSIMLDSNWVEGWGTVITPIGSASALRVREKSIDRVPNTPIVDVSNSLDFFTEDGNLSSSIVLEDGRAFYRKRTDLGITTSTLNLPVFSFRLQQNYPNPFKKSTTIAFSLEKSERVQIRSIDLKGNILQLLTDQYYSFGRHEFLWSNKDLPAGTYILEMRVGNQVQHRMMNIAK